MQNYGQDKHGLNSGSVVKMADKTTFIKLDRNIIYWRWYKNPKMLSVFIWLLVKANIKEGHFEKETIKRGSLVTSNAHIAEGCGITIQNARSALANLEETGEISRINRNHYQIVTINNYESYQSALSKSIEQLTTNRDGNQQATNKQITTIKERKKERRKEEKEEDGSFFDSPVGRVQRGTDAFRNVSHLILKAEEGTADDIPMRYRELCNNNFATYLRYRHQ